jgi:hypothetical protein
MEFSELRKEMDVFSFDEKRSDEADYFEVVVSKPELEKITPVLEKFLGPAITSTQNLAPQQKTMVDEMGGIMPGQSLYLRSENNQTFFAMLWPWGSGKQVTVKIGKQ